MLYFAYDGSINGDWVFHYALRLARNQRQPAITLLSIDEGRIPKADLEERLQLLAERCHTAELPYAVQVRPFRGSVATELEAAVPPGDDSYLVCGTRVREGRRGYMTGTVAEQLMRANRNPVLAVRVVNPGLLGHPRELLMPVSYLTHDLPSRLPFLRLLGPGLGRVQVLLVQEQGRTDYRLLSREKAERLLQEGWEQVNAAERELAATPELAHVHLDAHVVISDDVPKEIVIMAGRLRSQLIYMGASQRNLSERFFYGNPIEQVLRNTPCDVAIYHGIRG